MATPPKNVCLPENVYGGFDHNLFLGCSVMSFSASGGWNEQVSELTVQLVEDTCDAPVAKPKYYYNLSLTKTSWTDPDPGFYGLTYNIIGAPVYFRVGDFEFSGLVQSWEQTNADSGNPTFSVKIVDPRQIIEGTQLIINEYSGSVGSIYNLLNVYGFAEAQGTACPISPYTAGPYYQSVPGYYVPGDIAPDGAVFGSPSGAFGGADVNDNGMQWNQILAGTRILSCSYPIPAGALPFSPYGRVCFKAPSVYSAEGMGIMPADVGAVAHYYVDLEEVPIAPSYWRMNGTSIGLMDAISQICQDSGADYYVELVPVVGGFLGPGIHKFIKVRTADRVSAPALNSIDAFVGAAGREVASYNKGRELRNEVTSSFVVGGPKQSLYQAEQDDDPEGDGQPTPPEMDDMIVPYYGVDPSTGDVILPEQDADGYWYFDAPTPDLALQLADPRYGKAIAATIEINELEIIAAKAGFDTWMSYASSADTELWQAIGVDLSGSWDLKHMEKLIIDLQGRIATDKFRPSDFLAIRQGVFQPHAGDKHYEIAQVAFAWIEKFAKDYYGKKYQVRVPFTCGRTDSESGKILTSEVPSDGGWTEVTPVIGIAHPSLASDFFTLDDNRLGAFSRFDNSNGLELSGLGVNDFVSNGVKAWVKLGVEPDYVYIDKSTLFSPRAVVSLPQTILSLEHIPDDMQGMFSGLVDVINGMPGFDGNEAAFTAALEDAQHQAGVMLTHLTGSQKAVMPDAAAFGIKSNVLKYGPWGSAGPAGAVSVTSDEGLVPWEYGGFTSLNLAGNSIANAGVTYTQVTEEGSVTVAGYPDLPLGAELLASDAGGPFNGGGNNLVENRTTSSGSVWGNNYYFAPVFPWDGTYGPNVTSITTQVSDSGISTTYNLRTWTPKFGRFAKGNAERLKKIGRANLNSQKQIRAWSLQRLKNNQLALLDKISGDRPGRDIPGGVLGKAASPHEVLVGQLIPWNNADFKRPLAMTSSPLELPAELEESYGSKAFMSLDGLVRPVSVNGSGNLPPYANYPGTNCQVTASRGAQSPIDKPGEVGLLNQYNIPHTQPYFDPFSNPGSDVVSDLSDTPTIGHDIEVVGRDTGIPASSMTMPIQGYADSSDTADSDYFSDYRMLALRGPLLMQSWGYDLDGWPIPNKVDTPANARVGTFSSGPLECKFMDDWLRQTDTWPVAPIDLRYDRDRGVWTIPQYRDIVAKLECCIDPYGTGEGTQLSGPTTYDCDGNTIDEPRVLLSDAVGNPCMQSGDRVIARFDPYDCVYRIIERKTNSKTDDLFKFRLTECVCAGDSTGFGHRAEGWAQAMRLKWDADTETWSDDYLIKLWPGNCNSEDPLIGVSGLCGWAKIVEGSNPEISADCAGTGGDDPCSYPCDPDSQYYRDYHHPSGNGKGGQIITMEEIAEFIDFTTTENVGCITDTCFPSAIRSRGARASVASYWNGKMPSCSAGSVAVYFGKSIQKDITCLRGYGDCDNDPLYTWRGTAVLDRKSTSDALCSSDSCRDDNDCCKFVYRAVDVDIPMRAVDICCTGDYSALTNLDAGVPFYEIITRSGITSRINSGNTCQLILDSSLRVLDTNECYPPSGWDRAPLNTPLPFEGLAFGGGLWLTKASEPDAEMGLEGCPDGINDECLWHVQAGFKPLNNSGTCYKDGPDTTLTDDGTRFVNVIDFQGGLRAYDGPNKCDLLLRAGIQPFTSTKCIEDPSYDAPKADIYHQIEFARGLKAMDDNPDDCKFILGAGVEFYHSAGCVSGTPLTNDQLRNRFYLKDGLKAQDNESDPCAIDIGAGVYFGRNVGCVSGDPNSSRLKNRINLGCGLWAQDDADDCQVSISAGILIGGNPTRCVSGNPSTYFGAPYCHLELGRGLYGDHQGDAGDPCKIILGAGFTATNSTTCVSGTPVANKPWSILELGAGMYGKDGGDCKLIIGSAHTATTSSTCVSEADSPTANRPFNKLQLGGGMYAKDGGDCELIIGAGLTATNQTTCLTESDSPTIGRSFNSISLGGGLYGRDGGDCQIIMGAGTTFSNSSTCVSGTPTAGRPYNKVVLGRGVYGKDGTLDCQVEIGAGFEIGSSSTCVDSSDTNSQPHARLLAAEGLEIKHSADCTAEIGLYFNVGGIKANKISVGNCLEAVSDGSCQAKIQLKERYGQGTSHVTQTLLNGLTVTCCESGGVENVNFTSATLHFNSCGQLVDVTSGSDGSVGCTCPSGPGSGDA